MNRINPIHVAIALMVILLISVISLGSSKSKLTIVESEYKQTEKMASKIVGLKSAYGNKKEVKQSLKKILMLSQLRSAGIVQKVKKASISLSVESIDKNTLNVLMGKILNRAYNITAFKVKKLSENSVSFEMEIAW